MEHLGAPFASSTLSDIELKFNANTLKIFYSLFHVYLVYLNSQKYMRIIVMFSLTTSYLVQVSF